MCLILFAWESHPEYRLVLAANRDEFYERPTAHASFWADAPHLLAGRDLRAGGTWLGLTRGGRIAAVTNYRDPLSQKSSSPSRGALVTGFLLGEEAAKTFLQRISAHAGHYNGFNLLLGDSEGLCWYSNLGQGAVTLKPGIYGISNRLLDTPWPKVSRGKERLARALDRHRRREELERALFELLSDSKQAEDEELPCTGVGMEWERLLSPIFIRTAAYGTRSSTVILVGRNNEVFFTERNHMEDEALAVRTVRHAFRLSTDSSRD